MNIFTRLYYFQSRTAVTKLRQQIPVLLFLFLPVLAAAQEKYRLVIQPAERDLTSIRSIFTPDTVFSSRIDCGEYISKLPSLLQSKGYVTASLDSVNYGEHEARIVLYTGKAYRWARLDASRTDPEMLQAIGWRPQLFEEKPLDFIALQAWQERMLSQYENTGYPFAKVYLDSIQMDGDSVRAVLKTERGPLYHIDSLRVFGTVKLSNTFLEHYLDISPGSIYNKKKLSGISKRIRELPYVEEEQPASLTRLATGSILNLYLKEKKSSQINILVGFLPNNDQLSNNKLLLTGEANINLKNALGSGETIGLNWQRLQVKSPRLHIVFEQPYLFKSPLGVNFNFDIFRKDSTFLNINLQLGAQYTLGTTQVVRLFLNRFQTIVNGINTPLILQTRRLPEEGDLSSLNLGVEYDYNNTDYRLNPRSGNEFRITSSGGTKKIRKNNELLELKDPSDPGFDFGTLYDTVKLKTYQFRVKAVAAHYFPLGAHKSTLKTAINTGIFSSGRIFRNELFQIGGYKLLRGFDEESEYLSAYAIATMEYRLLLDRNSYFYVLADGGWGQDIKKNYTYIGTGLGLAFETKAGIFNIALGLGKRNDTEFNLRKSKLHFGFVSYF